jgi:uncharacterized protein YoaH (UPF0181 family)
MAVKHIGFGGAVAKVMKSGYSKKSATAIVASASRNASKSAKRANPKLKKVKTAKKKK